MIVIKNEDNNPRIDRLSFLIAGSNIENREKDIDNELYNILEKERRHLIYEDLMNINQVNSHKYVSAIYILSVMGFYMMIIQF